MVEPDVPFESFDVVVEVVEAPETVEPVDETDVVGVETFAAGRLTRFEPDETLPVSDVWTAVMSDDEVEPVEAWTAAGAGETTAAAEADASGAASTVAGVEVQAERPRSATTIAMFFIIPIFSCGVATLVTLHKTVRLFLFN